MHAQMQSSLLLSDGVDLILAAYSASTKPLYWSLVQSVSQAGLIRICLSASNPKDLKSPIRSWLKVKCTKRQEFVIAGYSVSLKRTSGFGALILWDLLGRPIGLMLGAWAPASASSNE